MTINLADSVPTTITFEGIGRPLTLRLMEEADGPAMLKFARTLPPHDLLFLRRDITEPSQIERWVRKIADGLAVTVLAFDGDTITGFATVERSSVTWSQHVGELRVLVDEAVRRHGIGRRLTEVAFGIALELGIEKVVAQMTVDQHGAISVFEGMGFRPEALLREHVQDRDGVKHDLLILSQSVEEFDARQTATNLDRTLFPHATAS